MCPTENVYRGRPRLEDIDSGDDAMTLPNFVVIGAMKAGTVSLRHYLDEHPDVFLARGGRFGEPNFFVAEQNWARGRDWYESLFEGAGSAVALGECSPGYTMAPQFGGVPERMAQVVPNARLVYVVRDPIARMRSMYMHQVSAGRERRRPEAALLDDRYLGPSLYGFQLAAFLDHFERGQVLVIASEVLGESPHEALSAVFGHLGVDPTVVDLDQRHRDHRSMDKPVPRLHDLKWLPAPPGQARSAVAARSAHRAVPAADDPTCSSRRLRDPTRTTAPARRAPRPRPAPLRGSPRLPDTQRLGVVHVSARLNPTLRRHYGGRDESS